MRPRHFADASCTPAMESTVRTEPPAFNPDPFLAGLMMTLAALNFAPVSCANVVPFKGIIKVFFSAL